MLFFIWENLIYSIAKVKLKMILLATVKFTNNSQLIHTCFDVKKYNMSGQEDNLKIRRNCRCWEE